MKKLGISLYPTDLSMDEIKDYIEKAAKLGYEIIFTSLHIPEFSLDQQVDFLCETSKIAHDNSMYLVSDVRGSVLKDIYKDYGLKAKFKEIGLSALRIDFELQEGVLAIVSDFGISDVYVNASTMDRKTIEETLKLTEKYGLKLKACHNFYPRPETGLSVEFFNKQNSLFKENNIEVSAFLPSTHKPRGPINEGLPTLETHRHMAFSKASWHMATFEHIDEILIGDLMASSDELSILSEVNDDVIILKINILDDSFRDALLTKVHPIRYDSGEYQVRLDGFRSMASYSGEKVKPNNTVERPEGSITVDNSLYGRYQGEVQIVTKDLDQDEKVNVVAAIEYEDLFKLEYLRNYSSVKFI